MFAYIEGVPGGSNLEKLVKDYKKNVPQKNFRSSIILLPNLFSHCVVLNSKNFSGRNVVYCMCYLVFCSKKNL